MAVDKDQGVLKAMKEAKTGTEMVLSWMTQAPERDKEKDLASLRLYIDRKPEMIEAFAHNQLTQMTERGILDRKNPVPDHHRHLHVPSPLARAPAPVLQRPGRRGHR